MWENKGTQEQDKIQSVGEQRESEWNKYNEPSIKKVQEVINYLAQNGLNHLIPIQFRKPKDKNKIAFDNVFMILFQKSFIFKSLKCGFSFFKFQSCL